MPSVWLYLSSSVVILFTEFTPKLRVLIRANKGLFCVTIKSCRLNFVHQRVTNVNNDSFRTRLF